MNSSMSALNDDPDFQYNIKLAEKIYNKSRDKSDVVRNAIQNSLSLDAIIYLIQTKSCPVRLDDIKKLQANYTDDEIKDQQNILVTAAECDRMDILKWLLKEFNYYPDQKTFDDNDRYSVLFEAMQRLDYEMIDWIREESDLDLFIEDATSIIKGNVWEQNEKQNFYYIFEHYLDLFLQSKSLNEILDRGSFLFWGKNHDAGDTFCNKYIKVLCNALCQSLDKPEAEQAILSVLNQHAPRMAFNFYTLLLIDNEKYLHLRFYLESVLQNIDLLLLHHDARALLDKLVQENKIRVTEFDNFDSLSLISSPPNSPLLTMGRFSRMAAKKQVPLNNESSLAPRLK